MLALPVPWLGSSDTREVSVIVAADSCSSFSGYKGWTARMSTLKSDRV